MNEDQDMLGIDTMPTGLVVANPASMHDPSAMGYSQIAVVPAGARLVLVAGQTGGPEKGPFADQVRVALRGVEAAMRAAGGAMSGVARLTVYIVDHDEAKHRALIAAVGDAFGGRLAPACTIVPLAQSGTDPRQLVEIEATGVVP